MDPSVSEAGLSCRLIRADRAGPPKRGGPGLSGRTQAALLAEAARRGRLSERDGELSVPAFTLVLYHPPTPLSQTQADGFSLLHFPFARLCLS